MTITSSKSSPQQIRCHCPGGKLTDDDLERIGGRADILIGKLQERYGYTGEQAEQEVTRFMEKFK